MNPEFDLGCWGLFMKTGLPQAYLVAKREERLSGHIDRSENNAPDGEGTGSARSEL